MAWQDVMAPSLARLDVEDEREERLAAQVRAGANWAMAALVARYQPSVTRYLTRLTGSTEMAQELAVAIFLRMERRVRGPQGAHQLRLWLLRASTEAGLEAIRPRARETAQRLEGPRLGGLLASAREDSTAGRMRTGLAALANFAGSTSRQVRKLIWSEAPDLPTHPTEAQNTSVSDGWHASEDSFEQDPRDKLRFQLVRAVLAELPYGDAQCLALHLIAGLNQAEVARALGITNSATRKRIVHGLQLFAQRYEAAAASLGLPSDLRDAGQRETAADVIEGAGRWDPYVDGLQPGTSDDSAIAPDPSSWSIASSLPPAPALPEMPGADLMDGNPAHEPEVQRNFIVDALPAAPDVIAGAAGLLENLEAAPDVPANASISESAFEVPAAEPPLAFDGHVSDDQMVESTLVPVIADVEGTHEGAAAGEVTAGADVPQSWSERAPEAAAPVIATLVPVLTPAPSEIVGSNGRVASADIIESSAMAAPSVLPEVRAVPVLTPAEPIAGGSAVDTVVASGSKPIANAGRRTDVPVVPVLTKREQVAVGQR